MKDDFDRLRAESEGAADADFDAARVARRTVPPGKPEPEVEEWEVERVRPAMNASKPPMGLAALGGLSRGLTLRTAPAISGVLGATIQTPKVPEDGEEAPSWLSRYRTERDESAGALEEQRTAHPRIFGATELVGDVAREGLTAAATGGLSATPMGQGVTGFLQGLAETKADLTTLEPSELARGVGEASTQGLLSAGMAKVGQVLAPALARKAGQAGEWLEEKAAEGATKAAGLIKQHVKKVGGIERVRELGRNFLDSKLVTALASKDDVLERAMALQDSAGGRMGEILNLVDQATDKGFDWDAAAANLWREVGLKMNPAGQQLIQPVVADVLAVFRKARDTGAGFGTANAVKSTLYKTIGKYSEDPGTRLELANALNRVLKTSIDDQLEQGFGRYVAATAQQSSPSMTATGAREVGDMAGKALRANWEQAKKEFGTGASAEMLARHGGSQELGNRWATPSSYGTAAVGTLAAMQANPEKLLQNLAIGAGAGLINKAGLMYGRSLTSTGQNALGKGLGAIADNPELAKGVTSVAGGMAGRAVGGRIMEMANEAMNSDLPPAHKAGLRGAMERGEEATAAFLGWLRGQARPQ